VESYTEGEKGRVENEEILSGREGIYRVTVTSVVGKKKGGTKIQGMKQNHFSSGYPGKNGRAIARKDSLLRGKGEKKIKRSQGYF